MIWLDNEMSYFSKNKKFTDTVKNILSKNQLITEKFEKIDSSNIEAFFSFLEKEENIEQQLKSLKEQQDQVSHLLTELNQQKDEITNSKEEFYKMKEENILLLESNKQLSSILTTSEMSGTFDKSANYYNKSKRNKLIGVCVCGLILIISAISSILFGLSIDEILKLSEKPIALLVHIIPKCVFFIILSSIMVFFIKEYRKESETSLDFTHIKAIADVTPGFRKQVSQEQHQEKVVLDAFNILLNIPSDSISKNTYEYKNLLNIFNSLGEEKKKEIDNLLRNVLNQNKETDNNNNKQE